MSKPARTRTRRISERIADDLFTVGKGTRTIERHATRLVLMDESDKAAPKNLGGWCKVAVSDAIYRILKELPELGP